MSAAHPRRWPRRRLLAGAAGVLLLPGAAIVIAALPSSAATTPVADGVYALANGASGKCVNVTGASADNSALLLQVACAATTTSQQWKVVDRGNGQFNLANVNSTRCIDVPSSSTVSGTQLQQYGCGDGTKPQQLWTFTASTGAAGKYLVKSVVSGLCISNKDGSTAGNNPIVEETCSDISRQQWSFNYVSGPTVPPTAPPTTSPTTAPTVGPTTAPPTGTGRKMEKLGRGVVAVRSGTSSVLVTWRLLGLDPDGIGFNVYRSAAGGAFTKLNPSVLTGGTNYADTTANLAQANTYQVRTVTGGVEGAASGAFTLSANHATEPVVRVPLRAGGVVKFLWVGDLDADGEYDYVIDRQTSPQTIEAYRSNGQFLWSANLGSNSTNQDNIEGGSATVDVGHNDGVTVYDFDSDGKAEVALRVANGVTFGNGAKYTNSDNNKQAIAILDGLTGAPRATANVPTDYLADGPMYARFGVGYLDGKTPSLVAYMKNRIGSGDFNLMYTAWKFSGTSLTQQWKFLRGSQNLPDGHNTRIVDVDGDGKDEIAEIGFVLNGDGKLRYSLAGAGVVHGDRFNITKIDPNRAGLQGYGVQQDNPSGLREYYYDAATGKMIWQHVEAGVADVGRAMAADVDSRYPGMETWSFSGLYNGPQNKLTQTTGQAPWPQLAFFWDGDTGAELLNNLKFEKWNPLSPSNSSSLPRLLSAGSYGAVNASQGIQPLFYGDILGDWREEAAYTNAAMNELIIFTTNIPSSTRLYTLAHNPEYRNAMTLKGYMQSHHVDYFLGFNMSTPPRPNISY